MWQSPKETNKTHAVVFIIYTLLPWAQTTERAATHNRPATVTIFRSNIQNHRSVETWGGAEQSGLVWVIHVGTLTFRGAVCPSALGLPVTHRRQTEVPPDLYIMFVQKFTWKAYSVTCCQTFTSLRLLCAHIRAVEQLLIEIWEAQRSWLGRGFRSQFSWIITGQNTNTRSPIPIFFSFA